MIVPEMQGFYFFVKFGLVLIYKLKVYGKILFDLIEKKYVQFITCIFLMKAFTFSSFERFLCWKSRNYSQIYLSGIINYWGSILTLYITWATFSLVCVLSVFFSFFLVFLFFYQYFPWQTLTIHKMGRERE